MLLDSYLAKAHLGWRSRSQGFAAESTGALEVIPAVTGGELIISRLVFTKLVLITAHAKKIDANRHMIANKPA